MNRQALQLLCPPPEAHIRCAPTDDPRALERVVEILARIVKRTPSR